MSKTHVRGRRSEVRARKTKGGKQPGEIGGMAISQAGPCGVAAHFTGRGKLKLRKLKNLIHEIRGIRGSISPGCSFEMPWQIDSNSSRKRRSVTGRLLFHFLHMKAIYHHQSWVNNPATVHTAAARTLSMCSLNSGRDQSSNIAQLAFNG